MRGKIGKRPIFFYLRTVDLLTIKGRGFNAASAFLVASVPPSFHSFIPLAFDYSDGACSTSIGLLLNLLRCAQLRTAAATGLSFLVTCFLVAGHPACAPGAATASGFLSSHARPKVPHRIICTMLSEARDRALLLSVTALSLSHNARILSDVSPFPPRFAYTVFMGIKTVYDYLLMQKPYTVKVITEYGFCRKPRRLPLQRLMPIWAMFMVFAFLSPRPPTP